MLTSLLNTDIDHKIKSVPEKKFRLFKPKSNNNFINLAKQLSLYSVASQNGDLTQYYALSCHEQAKSLAKYLSLQVPKSQQQAIELGLSELIFNAIEHGNLNLSKQKYMRDLKEFYQEIDRRQQLDNFRHKKVFVKVILNHNIIHYVIEDTGKGFDYISLLAKDFKPQLITQQYGRGILIAKHFCFDDLEYIGCGNVVHCKLRLAN